MNALDQRDQWLQSLVSISHREVGQNPNILLNAWSIESQTTITVRIAPSDDGLSRRSVFLAIGVPGDHMEIPDPTGSRFDIGLPTIGDVFILVQSVAQALKGKKSILPVALTACEQDHELRVHEASRVWVHHSSMYYMIITVYLNQLFPLASAPFPIPERSSFSPSEIFRAASADD